MIERVTLLSGPVCAGKSTLANHLSQFADHLRTRDLIRSMVLDIADSRQAFQDIGEQIVAESNGDWIPDAIISKYGSGSPPRNYSIVIDSVRYEQEIQSIRRHFHSVIHIHVTAPAHVLEERYCRRLRSSEEFSTALPFRLLRANSAEKDIDHLARIADVILHSDQASPTRLFELAWTEIQTDSP